MSAVPSQAPPSSAPPAPDHTDQPPTRPPTVSPTRPPPVVEPPTPSSQPSPPPPPPSSQPPAPPTPTTHAVPEPSTSSPIPTDTQTATPIQPSPSPPPDTSQLPSSIRPTRVPPRPTQTATAFPASSKPPTTDPSPLSAVAILGIIFAVVAAVALLVCLFTRRAKRIKQFSTPASSPPRAPMTFKRDPSPLLSPSYPHSQTSVSSNSTSPFRPPHKQHHPPPYLPNYGLSLRPQLIPPSNPSSQFPTTVLSPNHLHPTQYVPTTSRNSFCTPSNGSSTAVWYGDPSHGMTLPPNSPYEDYLRLYNGDGSLADAAYYSDYSAAQAAASENLPPKPRFGETLFYETGEFKNQQETDPRYVSSRPIQGYEKPPNDVPPPTGKLSITNGYSSDVNSEDSDSFTGRYTRLASSGHAVGDAATRSSLRNSFSGPLGPVAGSKDGELSTGRLTPSGNAASYLSVRNCSSSEQVGPARRSEDGDSSSGNHRLTYAAGDTTTRSSARNFSATRSEDGNSSTGRFATSGRAVGNTETRLASSEPIGRSENGESSTGRLTSTPGHHTTARSILGKSPLTSPKRVENAEAFLPTDTQNIDVPPKRESLGKNHMDESDAGMISNRSSSFFSRLPSSSKPEPKVDSNGEISDGSAFDSSEDEGRKGYYSGDFRNI